MSAEQPSRNVRGISVITLKSDILKRGLHVGLVPSADMRMRRHDQDLAIEPNLAMSAASDATNST